MQQIDSLPKRIINVQRFEDRNARHFDPKDIMIQDYVVFLFESDLAFLGIITLILLPVILLTVSRTDVIPVCKLYLQRSLVTWRVPTQHALSPRLLSNFAWNA